MQEITLESRPRFESIPAGADNRDFMIFGMNASLHGTPSVNEAVSILTARCGSFNLKGHALETTVAPQGL